MDSLGKERRASRYSQMVEPGTEVSASVYNLVLGGVLVYGILMNLLFCVYLTNFALSMNPLVLMIGYIVLVIAGTLISARSNNALLSFIGYNLVVLPMGLVLSISVYYYGGVTSLVVVQAFMETLIITAIMCGLSVLFPSFFEKIGGFLFAGLIGILVASIFQLFFAPVRSILPYFGAVLFSLYIGYDIYRSQRFAKTLNNAVDCALDVYLDIINLFLFLLRIFGKNND